MNKMIQIIIALLAVIVIVYLVVENKTDKKEIKMVETQQSTNQELDEDIVNNKWSNFVKPSDEQLQLILNPLQYSVTQKEGTEKPFTSQYDKNYEQGIYVDIVSGEPLFSSEDKYDSGTGWPSFVKPINFENIVLVEDKKLFDSRTEVRSRFADSHLGHVFDDGPKDRGGKRYCMNGVALKFISKADMEKLGYREFIIE